MENNISCKGYTTRISPDIPVTYALTSEGKKGTKILPTISTTFLKLS